MNKITTILFDLDGTLLPLDQEIFTKIYFGSIAKKLAPLGYNPEELINAIWTGTKAMVKNVGEKTNEEVFWDSFASIFGDEKRADEKHFHQYYVEDFDQVKACSTKNPSASKIVNKAKELGFKLALATNPIFPAIATEKRIAWAGLNKEDFEFITTYENSNHCKPNLAYYLDILNKLGVTVEECLMVGNDVTEDMVAEKLGMKVFLLTDCLINKENKDISMYPHGNFEDLQNFIEKLN